MYCYHCAKHIDETKLEAKTSSFNLVSEDTEVGSDAKITYVCPRCGHLIKEGATEEQIKSLSRAAHAQVQRARNSIAVGMGFNSIGLIALIVAVLFFFLAKKPSNQYRLVVDCAEFYVSIVLAVASVASLSYGVFRVVSGFLNKKANSRLLKDINNRTFVQ